jgi:peptide/nickel transport system permease protein
VSRIAATLACGALALLALGAPWLVPHHPSTQFRDLAYAPPNPPRVIDAEGHLRAPFIYPLRLVDRLERRYEPDRTTPVPLGWNQRAPGNPPTDVWLPLGGDALGRDVLSRLLLGARTSFGIAVIAALLALGLGAAIGGLAGAAGGWLDEWLMRLADFVLVLPAIYLVLTLRAALPLVVTPPEVFWMLVAVFALAGWPYPARGVRAIVAGERRKEYAEAARALGASRLRILLMHLLPAASGFLAVQAGLLVPAFILAEATLSFVGFGFPEPYPSLGLMLQDAAGIAALSEAPWLLAPAAAIVLAILAIHQLAQADTPVGPALGVGRIGGPHR